MAFARFIEAHHLQERHIRASLHSDSLKNGQTEELLHGQI
jgi:hypothetical protein